MSETLVLAFERLRAAGRIELTAAERERLDRGETTLAIYLGRHRLITGQWTELIRPAQFHAINHAWCGPVGSRADCIVALCERGMAFLPSLSSIATFDAAWYADQLGAAPLLDAEELYRHFLNEGYANGLTPSEPFALHRIWGNDAFPNCFDWQGWTATIGHPHDRPDRLRRAAALDEFLDQPGAERMRFVSGEGSTHFLAMMGERAWRRQGLVDDARQLLCAALEAGGLNGWVHHLLGDLERDQGDDDAALAHYRAGMTDSSPNRWSYLNAAAILLDRSDWRAGLGALWQGRSAWQETAPWRRLYERGMHLWSQDCVRRIRSVHLDGQSDAGALEEADNLAAEIASRLPDPQLFSPRTDGVLVITARPAVISPAESHLVGGVTVLDLGTIDRDDYLGPLLAHGTVIFHEAPFTFGVVRAMLAARRMGKRVVAWLGDLADWEGHALARHPWGQLGEERSWLSRISLPELALAARYADEAVTTLAGARQMLASAAPHVPCTVLVQPAADLRGRPRALQALLVITAGALAPGQRAPLLKGLCGADKAACFLVERELAQDPALRDIADRLFAIPDGMELPRLARLIGEVDGVIVPPGLDHPYSAKDEAAARAVPAVCLPKILDSPEQVVDAVSALLSTPHGSVAPTQCKAGALPIAPEPAPETPRKRVLMTNVWAPPQQFGGAARIFADNIDYYLDHHRDEFEFAAFGSDEYNETCGQFTMDTYRGIPVFRVATPGDGDTYWRGASAMSAARFGAVLDSWRPNLVHFHCLQRLTASLADECRRRGIGYIVTMHDGWWISDFVFVSDEEGRLALPLRDWFAQDRGAGRDLAASALRARHLRQTLLAAERRLAESKEFAEIYRACGIPCDVVENGASRIAPAQRQPAGEFVEMCHVGGLEPHKGAYLVEAALRAGAYANLRLTIVDLDQNSAFRLGAVWGTTPVTIIGRVPASAIAAFYARMNVLLAPSVWPESFGLISREALSHGMWVVAGDRGAMGNPVAEGINGFVVPVDDATGLADALARIDAAPERFKASPPASAANSLRTVEDQARELICLYRELTGADIGAPERSGGRRQWTKRALAAMTRFLQPLQKAR